MQNCPHTKPATKIITTILAASLISLTVFFLYIHRMHLAAYSGFFSLLIIFMCPLMHIFMHGGHGHHDDHGEHKNKDTSSCHHEEHKHKMIRGKN